MPQADNDWQVFNLDYVEDALVTILNNAGVPAYGRRSTEIRETPCAILALQTGETQGQRFIRFPQINKDLVQPHDTWNFTLKAQAITNRSTNGADHGPLVGKIRAQLQYYWLTLSFTRSVSPYHAITDIRESEAPSEFINDDNLDVTELTFSGMLNIRNDAWPATIS